MLSAEENDLLTRVGAGTPMGALIRRYWLPALLSEELPNPDSAPVRVRLLGEQLVAFRDTEGRVGLLEEHCPHRQASLALGRNEESGLRCIYHGWKYDVGGQCVDMPTEPAETRFKAKVWAKAYPVREVVGVLWAYLGPPDRVPPFPDFQWLKLPASQSHPFKTVEECNYAQAIEGGIDSAHLPILHRLAPWGQLDDTGRRSAERDLAPRLEVEHTWYGFRYAAVRKAHDGANLVRITPYILPVGTVVPPGTFLHEEDRVVNFWVPRDDFTTWHFQYFFNPGRPLEVEWRIRAGGHQVDALYRKLRNLDNWYLQDRDAMRTKSMSGIEGVVTQDHAVNETQGPILDRGKEHLAGSDVAIIAMRQLLLDTARAVAAGKDPPGIEPGVAHDRITSEAFLLTPGMPWQQASAA